LSELNVGGNPIGDDGVSVIVEGLQYQNNLTKLYVDNCGLTMKGTT